MNPKHKVDISIANAPVKIHNSWRLALQHISIGSVDNNSKI